MRSDRTSARYFTNTRTRAHKQDARINLQLIYLAHPFRFCYLLRYVFRNGIFWLREAVCFLLHAVLKYPNVKNERKIDGNSH